MNFAMLFAAVAVVTVVLYARPVEHHQQRPDEPERPQHLPHRRLPFVVRTRIGVRNRGRCGHVGRPSLSGSVQVVGVWRCPEWSNA